LTEKTAFVLMPFAEEFTDVYKYLIKDGLENAGFTVKRADDIKSQNNILSGIIKGITSSDLIITDLTGENPNVYYELGIAHALQKNVILLTQEISELPFDLRSYRVISYNVHFSKMNEAKKELFELATKAFSNNLAFSNPVKDFSLNFIKTKDSIKENQIMNTSLDEELGLLDYLVKLEDGLEEMTEIIDEVGSKLELELTPEINKAAKKLKSAKTTSKQKRHILKNHSTHIQSYGAFLKGKNQNYKILLNDVKSSLEYILGGGIKIDEDADVEGLQELVTSLEGIQDASFNGRQGFVTLIEAMESIPKLEKNFDREKLFMIIELKSLIDNIDLTASISARASRLGKSLLN